MALLPAAARGLGFSASPLPRYRGAVLLGRLGNPARSPLAGAYRPRHFCSAPTEAELVATLKRCELENRPTTAHYTVEALRKLRETTIEEEAIYFKLIARGIPAPTTTLHFRMRDYLKEKKPAGVIRLSKIMRAAGITTNEYTEQLERQATEMLGKMGAAASSIPASPDASTPPPAAEAAPASS